MLRKWVEQILWKTANGSFQRPSKAKRTFTQPCGEKDQLRQFWKYRFTLLGITFIFLLGNRLDQQARQMCTYRSPRKWIYSGEDVSDNLIRDLAPSMRTARPVGSLAYGRISLPDSPHEDTMSPN